MKKLAKWADRKVIESTKPKDLDWESKLASKLRKLNQQLANALRLLK